jgi:hypothetical protein
MLSLQKHKSNTCQSNGSLDDQLIELKLSVIVESDNSKLLNDRSNVTDEWNQD